MDPSMKLVLGLWVGSGVQRDSLNPKPKMTGF